MTGNENEQLEAETVHGTMRDVEINLYHHTKEDGPTHTMAADYATLARTSDHDLTKKITSAFKQDVEDCPMMLEIREVGREPLTRRWSPITPEPKGGNDLEYELELQARDLVSEWRAE